MDLWHQLIEKGLKALPLDGPNPFPSIWTIAGLLAVPYIAYCIGVAIYRLTLHPLAQFPGPFLCRVGYIQQCYYEAILNGRFLERLSESHRKYVRIGPNEGHINDPLVYHEIYKSNSQFAKDPTSYALGMSEAMAFAIPVEKHRQKRKILDPNFSKHRVGLMKDGLYEELELVFDRISQYEKRGEEVPIMELHICYMGDIISRYLFSQSLRLVSSDNFIQRSFTKGIWFAVHCQFVRNALLGLPRWMMAYEKDRNARPLSFRELADESTGILNAGTEPTATMLSYATYFWLKFPHVQKPILDELAEGQLQNGRLPLRKVENLPYFTGFIKESLGYMPLVPGRLPRTGLYVPSVQKTIPEGSVVGLSHLAIHFDPEIFDQPEEFRPERWIGEQGKERNPWLLSFSKERTDWIGKMLAFARRDYCQLARHRGDR
ncbi:cytochrome P450 [Aspergillus sclerotiicarbonarius CBS 121057]|uniref:Cytochrome P450 n=1 Tax=Aspergillus sclerotiicarbonarius (strain CBS 121057 / IBT 28362) TaxID=1448318 RepID=A0A319EPU0_ASPSB|nr:cytochrome P450 [Aspergillus sclerotiicarbonarius CBS 121057]